MPASSSYRLSFEQKVAAIHSLLNLGNSIAWRFNTHGAAPQGGWYCSAERVEISDGVILSGVLGNGSTPQEALDDLWDQLTNISGSERRVVIGAYSDVRRAVRWNGYMWEPFKEPVNERA